MTKKTTDIPPNAAMIIVSTYLSSAVEVVTRESLLSTLVSISLVALLEASSGMQEQVEEWSNVKPVEQGLTIF